MSQKNDNWFTTTYHNAEEWLKKPEVRNAIAKTGLALGVLGFVLYNIFKEESNPDDQIQAIAERIIAAGKGFFMP